MIVRAARPTSQYLTLANSVARDERLSYKALGVLVNLLSRPDGWTVNRDQLAAGEGREGVSAVRTALTELEQCGYLVRTRVKRADGTFSWVSTVYDTPQVDVSDADTDPWADTPDAIAPATQAAQAVAEDRAADEALFAAIVGTGNIYSFGTWRDFKEGTFTTEAVYRALVRTGTRRPGAYLSADAKPEAILDRLGLMPVAA